MNACVWGQKVKVKVTARTRASRRRHRELNAMRVVLISSCLFYPSDFSRESRLGWVPTFQTFFYW